jgi:predicted phosphodiesterase
MWNSIWAERELQPKSDILLRGHVHYDYFTGSSDFLAVVCPGLEWTNRYGARNCTSLVTVGLVVFDVEEDGNYSWEYKIAKLPTQKAKVVEG